MPFIDRQSMRSAALKITWYPMVTYWLAVSEEEGLQWLCWTSPLGVPLTEKEGAVGSDFKLDCRRTASRSN